MPFTIGETKPINRRTLIRDLSDRSSRVEHVTEHVTEDGTKKVKKIEVKNLSISFTIRIKI